ncbi:hypothetical protein Taro_002541 [Colocasia esculenta]|uniref:Pentatricopeptide repeat-containing protein n=1 Tax=Colocasia esculenta TaxID=4460 RepID=A0A843TIX0_COLES|nr:hypothetical protein [Colocasia esculenta]
MARKGEGPAIGIDVGMTYSYVGIWQHDRASYVAFTDPKRLLAHRPPPNPRTTPAPPPPPSPLASPPPIFHHLSSDLVDRILKRLWNDAPHALLFFRALLLLRRLVASNFDHALDLTARLGDCHAVGRLLSLRLKLRVVPTPRTFAILMERHAAAGKPDRAVRLFLSMHRHSRKQDLSSFNTLLDVLCKSRHVEKAQLLFRALRGRFRPDAVTYNIMANGWCLLKRTSRALETLKEMVTSGLEPTVTTYNILLKGYFRSGQEEAWTFFLQMKKRSKEGSNCKPDVVSYTTIVHGLGLAGHVDRARKVFDEMVKAAYKRKALESHPDRFLKQSPTTHVRVVRKGAYRAHRSNSNLVKAPFLLRAYKRAKEIMFVNGIWETDQVLVAKTAFLSLGMVPSILFVKKCDGRGKFHEICEPRWKLKFEVAGVCESTTLQFGKLL